jgi:hypothetical protein
MPWNHLSTIVDENYFEIKSIVLKKSFNTASSDGFSATYLISKKKLGAITITHSVSK